VRRRYYALTVDLFEDVVFVVDRHIKKLSRHAEVCYTAMYLTSCCGLYLNDTVDCT
jgi:hypothetical protein